MEYYQRTRARKLNSELYTGNRYSYGSLVTSDQYKFAGREITSDSTHPWFYLNRMAKLQKYGYLKEMHLDVGGPFESTKYKIDQDGRIYDAFVTISGLGTPYRYVGPQFPVAAEADAAVSGNRQTWWGTVEASNDLQLDALGSTAISRCGPTNPHSSALNALIELYRDGLPSAIGLNTLRRQDLGGEYLNYEFGILPTISDIKAIGGTYRQADKLLRQYYRDSGRVVRRRYEFPSETRVVETSVTEGVPPTPTLVTPLYENPYGKLRKVVTETKNVWFSGAFTYYAKAPSSVLAIRDQVQKWNYLYGISPSTDVLWNALPYSWAADWVTNIGDVMNNVSMFQNDGLVMQYGYVMEHVVRRVEYVHTGTVLKGAGPVFAKQVFISDHKRRRKATPFGFGAELSGFTDRQWAILAALGLSRGRGAL